MSDDTQKETGTPEASSASDQTDQVNSPPEGFDRTDSQSAEGGDTPEANAGDGSDIKVPKTRLDQEAQKRRQAEQKAEELSKQYEALETKLKHLGKSLAGEPDKDDPKQRFKQLADQYGVPQGFVEEFVQAAKEEATRDLESKFQPIKQQQAGLAWQNEVAQLEKEVPDARDLTKEEREKMKKMAFSPAYSKVPLKEIFTIVTADNPRGRAHTAEGASGGRASKNETESLAEKVKNMSLDEFREWSEKKAAGN